MQDLEDLGKVFAGGCCSKGKEEKSCSTTASSCGSVPPLMPLPEALKTCVHVDLIVNTVVIKHTASVHTCVDCAFSTVLVVCLPVPYFQSVFIWLCRCLWCFPWPTRFGRCCHCSWVRTPKHFKFTPARKFGEPKSTDGTVSWYAPVTLADLVALQAQFATAAPNTVKYVCGNTADGVEKYYQTPLYPISYSVCS